MLKKALIVINSLLLLTAAVIAVFSYTLPDNYYITDGAGVDSLPSFVTFSPETGNVVAPAISDSEQMTTGQLRVFGVIPVKEARVYNMGTPMLIPSGQSFGIKMFTDGVMVTDISGFESGSKSLNSFVSPAKDAGIKPGDVIKTISTVPVTSNADVSRVVRWSDGETMTIVFTRDDEEKTVKVTPQKGYDGVWKIGMWVRDSSAGIGTMTFFDPATNRFAGLGHPVCDNSSGALLPLASGEVVPVSVENVIRGRAGAAGELTGKFITDSRLEIGKLLVNSQSGVYGTLNDGIIDIESNTLIPLGTRSQIKEGKAFIISTIDSSEPTLYSIEIETIDLSGKDGKDMVIKVTDDRLLTRTGGIVQGMSGSPILQDSRLVGAVTHVFVNNPQKGYAIFADTMYAEEIECKGSL
ncbi:MAG: SpoIVB peptidase [Ruminococcus sp.]|jgi:stage IV sporulation protein B|nr:SpoIVB peptidase [Ruminococcus sp.]